MRRAGRLPDTLPELTEIHQLLYERVLRNGQAHVAALTAETGLDGAEVAAGVSDLLRMHLLRLSPQDGALIPSSPEVAAAHLTGPIEAQVQLHRRSIEQIRSHLLTLNPTYIEARHLDRGGTSVDVLTGLPAVQAELGRLTSGCRTEVFAAHPVLPPPEALDEGLRRTLDVIERGVRIRTLYPHAVLAHPYIQAHFAKMTDHGSRLRTSDQVAERIIVFDREVAVLPDRVRPSGDVGAVVVREPAVVDYLYRSLDSLWSTATPFCAAPGGFGYGQANGDLRRAIVELLALGHKDEGVARRLSMSVRACRRHIAAIMESLGAESRFQAGYQAAVRGLLGPSGAAGPDRVRPQEEAVAGPSGAA
ncbi:hypothetical protein [Streptomyces globisporus]|uniref:hypothetical protein n=1 Tax=Streptomyces globisporus TaxID=1908 RepID=UPI00068D6460|nr:hypothetical protein [Streptomyces globisporus]